jgi:hypothetical protein
MTDTAKMSYNDFINATVDGLKMIGTGNATAAIASGVAFNAFSKAPDLQADIKYLLITFLVGIVSFIFSYLALFLARIDLDLYYRADEVPEEWEPFVGVRENNPLKHLTAARKRFRISLILGGVSFLLLMGGICFAIHAVEFL